MPESTNSFSLRAYLAGGGATTALIAGAVVAFLAIAALVAFDGLPFADGDASGEVQIAEVPTGAPETAAVALGGAGAAGAVADAPATGSALAPAPGSALETGGPGSIGGSGSPIGDDDAPPADPESEDPTPAPDGGGGSQGPLGGTVDNLEQSAGNLGLDLPLNEVTGGLTRPLDRTLNRTLNDVGGLLGNPKLGDQVSSGVNGLTGGLLR